MAKDKKHSYVTPQLVDKSMKYSKIKEDCLEPIPEYDDWSDSRDGFRHNELQLIKLRDKLKKMFIPKHIRHKEVAKFKAKNHFWINVDHIK